MRQKIAALCEEEELSIGEIALLLEASQPKISRQVAALREQGVLAVRKEGTRVWVSRSVLRADDAVVFDALKNGRTMLQQQGVLEQIPLVILEREKSSHAFFTQQRDPAQVEALPDEFLAYLYALSPALSAGRGLAVDLGTGDGSALGALAPLYDKVIAVDRSAAQLQLAEKRCKDRGFGNVETFVADYDDPALRLRLEDAGGADVVLASRMLHHAPKPSIAFGNIAELLNPSGGQLVVIDYLAHHDEQMREQRADAWLGFERIDLLRWAKAAGLHDPSFRTIPPTFYAGEPDSHLQWQVLNAHRALCESPNNAVAHQS